jgi:hypothetical protein
MRIPDLPEELDGLTCRLSAVAELYDLSSGVSCPAASKVPAGAYLFMCDCIEKQDEIEKLILDSPVLRGVKAE